MYRKRKQNTTYYARVSTAIRVNGYSLDAQKDKLKKCRISGYGNYRRIFL